MAFSLATPGLTQGERRPRPSEDRIGAVQRRRPVLIYLVSEDWYFLSHRLPMACAARAADYEVHVATRVGEGGAAIEAHGFRLHPLAWRRGSLRPHDLLHLTRQIRALYRRIAPDLVHQVALQPSVIGSLAASGLPITVVNAITGLGSAFTSTKARARFARGAMRPVLRRLFDRTGTAVLVQNLDDQAMVEGFGVAGERIHLIAGSGIDLESFVPLPEPDGPLVAAFVGRLLVDKGLRTLVAAQKLLAVRGRPLRLMIAGTPDPANPSSIPSAEIEAWRRLPGVSLPGHVADIRTVWAQAHIAVLPSFREGLPKSLLEAAACGRALVATDVPGCREIARAGVNALLVAPDDPASLADALDRLARDAALRGRFAQAGRRLVEREFGAERVGRETVALYDKLLGRDGARWALVLDHGDGLNQGR